MGRRDPDVPRRKPGEGQVDLLPSGKLRARLVIDGKRVSVGTFSDPDEMKNALDAARTVAVAGVRRTHAHTLDALADRVFRRMQLDGHRGMAAKRARWENHVSPILGGHDFRRLTRADIRDLEARMRRKLGRRTVAMYLGTVGQVLEAALEDGEIASNPARLPRRSRLAKHAAEDSDAWTYLSSEEQGALLACQAIPPHDRLAIAVMLGAGLRVGELAALRLSDVSVGEEPRVVVRFGSPPAKGKPAGPTKTGKTRIVPLFGVALAAMREWLELLPNWCPRNRSGAAFPAKHGGWRSTSWLYFTKGKRWGDGTTPWARYLAAAGINRRVRVHDLRHTCAASLVSGWWGPAWELIEVRDLLGHASITMTQRYAHLAPSSLAARARVRAGGRSASREPHGSPTDLGFEGSAPLPNPRESLRNSAGRGEVVGVLGFEPQHRQEFRELTSPRGARVGLDAVDGLRAVIAGDLDTARAALEQLVGPAVARAFRALGEPGEARALVDALTDLLDRDAARRAVS